MPEEIKFIEEELNKINNFQERYLKIRDEFGDICLNKINLRNQIEELDILEDKLSNDFAKAKEEQKTFFDEVNKKYGEGSFNPNTGIFTPVEQNKSEKTK